MMQGRFWHLFHFFFINRCMHERKRRGKKTRCYDAFTRDLQTGLCILCIDAHSDCAPHGPPFARYKYTLYASWSLFVFVFAFLVVVFKRKHVRQPLLYTAGFISRFFYFSFPSFSCNFFFDLHCLLYQFSRKFLLFHTVVLSLFTFNFCSFFCSLIKNLFSLPIHAMNAVVAHKSSLTDDFIFNLRWAPCNEVDRPIL